jgi:hypothetical protein
LPVFRLLLPAGFPALRGLPATQAKV